MSLSLYNMSIPVLDKAMTSLKHLLEKGEENAKSRDIAAEVFLNARLAPDMYPLKKQVQVVASLIKNCPHRIVGSEPPIYEETEETFDELYGLIAKTRKELAKFSSADLDGKEDRAFSIKLGPMDVDFTGITYLQGFTMPNVYFHNSAAYNILRHNGVPLGKFDFFGGTL
ncbi:MAG: DUF1993 domain-containing protein [Hellea sp.]|nr:DUF1993 domain-containing protein [Hellea sp.]